MSEGACDKQDCGTLLADYEKRLAAIAELAAQGGTVAFYDRSKLLDRIYKIAAGRPQVRRTQRDEH